MKKSIIAIILLSVFGLAFETDKPAYMLYTGEGEQVSYENMIKELEKADLVFFGEQHDDAIGHWLEFEITKDLYKAKGQDLILAAEMFENDNQVILSEYLEGKISKKSFEAEARLWPNYQGDYKPLVEFAKEKGLFFIASNVPRRYAAVVHTGGLVALDSLSDEAKRFLPPLPIAYDPEVKCYADMMKMTGMMAHVNENFPKAQAIKDATMAHFTMKQWKEGKLIIHYNGSYHSNNFEGIIWHIRQQYPELNIMTIANEKQADLSKLNEEYLGLGSYVLLVHESMTKTR